MAFQENSFGHLSFKDIAIINVIISSEKDVKVSIK